MKVVAVASSKGGVGKSTTCAHLAVSAQADGMTVGVVDLDPQGSLRDWQAARTAAGLPSVPVAPLRHNKLASAMPVISSRGYDLLIIDTPPSHDQTERVAAAIEVANLVLIPVKPGPSELRAVGLTVDLVLRAGRKFLFLPSIVRPRGGLTDEVIAELAAVGPVSDVRLGNRVAFETALATGEGASEFAPRSQAAKEAAALWHLVKGQL